MKTKWRQWFSAAVTCCLASSASAQKEQWLEYHVSQEGRGYRYLDLTNTAPPNIALPKFNAQPYFARWATPLDPSGGRWLCFDRTRKSGPYDRLYIDSKGDGRLDNKPPISAERLDQYFAYFDPAKLVFKGEDGSITYHLALRFMKFERSDVRLLVSSGGYYAGDVDLAGKKRHLELIDNNVNGTFNDQGIEASDTDCVEVQNDRAGQRFLGKLLEVDGQFFRIEVARDGAFVKVQKAEGLELGQLRVPETISEFVAFGANGHFIRKPVKGQLSLPAGNYRVLSWTIDRKDAKGAAWRLMGHSGKKAASFEIAAAKPATLQVGEPIRVGLRAGDTNNPVGFNLSFQGQYDESIQITKGNQNPPGPRLTLASLNGSYRSTNAFEFG